MSITAVATAVAKVIFESCLMKGELAEIRAFSLCPAISLF